MSADLIKQLFRAYANRDSELFRKSALQLATNESRVGHSRVAEELREIISKFPEVEAEYNNAVSIARPKGELSDLVEGGYRDERLRDIVLNKDSREELDRIIVENRKRATLQQFGVGATRRLLFFGPPGCGKTLAAKVLAGELGLPLMTVRFDALFSKFLGATATHLRSIFEEMPRRPAVYFFDEFDALGKHRGDNSDVGEIKRVVSSFLQLMDADKSHSLIIAATNFETVLDKAIIRRFDTVLPYPLPCEGQLEAMITLRLSGFDLGKEVIHRAATCAKGFSFAEAARGCEDAIRSMALSNRTKLNKEDVLSAFERVKARAKLLSPKTG